MAIHATSINFFVVLFTCCASANGNVHNFRCYTASTPCTRGVKMARMKECFKYRGRCMERIYPENVTQCCSGYVGKHCDNYVQDEFYFASSVASEVRQRQQRHINDKRGPKGDKGDRGPEGFVGMPGRKGEPGMTVEKGQKGKPGISVKGERGKKGRKGKAGRRGQKGDTGQIGPPGLPGLPGLRGSRKTGECNCSDLASKVQDLESLVRDIIDGRVVIPSIGRSPGQDISKDDYPPRGSQGVPANDHHPQGSQVILTGDHPPLESQEIPTYDRPPSQASQKKEMPDNRQILSTTMKTTPLMDEESEPVISTLSPIERILEQSIVSDPNVDRQTTALTTEIPVKCNASTAISNCPSGSFCKNTEPLFIQTPPPFPSNINFSWTYFKRLSCCSTETLDFAFMYYKNKNTGRS